MALPSKPVSSEPTLQQQPVNPVMAPSQINTPPVVGNPMPQAPRLSTAPKITQAEEVHLGQAKEGIDLDVAHAEAGYKDNDDERAKYRLIAGQQMDIQEYAQIGSITSDDVISKDYDQYYKQFEEIVITTKRWLQDLLQEKDKVLDLAEARKSRKTKTFKDMKTLIDQLLVRNFATSNQLPQKDVPIVISLVSNEILGLGPIEPLWSNPNITEVMVNGPDKTYIEVDGQIQLAKGVKFRDQEHLIETIQQILSPLNKTLDVAHTHVDGRLVDGSRINATHPVIGPKGPFLTIRRFPETIFTLRKMIEFGSASPEMAADIGNKIYHGCSVLISGGTGSGKEIVLSALVPTPTKMTTMGELKVGDYVLDETGKPTKVTGYYLQEPKPFNYIITFSDGTTVTAGAEHNWYTSTRATRRAWSRPEKESRIVNAKRERFATDSELAELEELLISKQDSDLISAMEFQSVSARMVDVARRVIRTNQLLSVKTSTKGEKLYQAHLLIKLVRQHINQDNHDQRFKNELESVKTTQEIFDTLRYKSGHANHAIRLISESVPYAEKELLVEPYTFGAWLGAGYSSDGKVCGVNQEIFNEIKKTYTEESRKIKPLRENQKTEINVVKFVGLKQQLKELGVLLSSGQTIKEHGESKFIPEQYLYSSEEQRRALIAGLLDTDGTVEKRGSANFTNTNKKIIDGMRQILHSLRYQTTLTSKTPMYRDHITGEKKEGKLAYTVSFFPKEQVFRLPRKMQKLEQYGMKKSQGHRQELRYIVDIQKVEWEPTACITVDSPNHLYLVTDAFIPTHNTSTLNALTGVIPARERVITIEDNLELRPHPDKHVIAMEARASRAKDGDGAVTIRDLVKNALRQRPDRIIVGEVRDATALDLVNALSTGHDGSMATVHANNAIATIDRMVGLILQAGELDNLQALTMIGFSIDIIVNVKRFTDGSRHISEIAEVPTYITVTEGGKSTLMPNIIWKYIEDEVDQQTGKITGHFQKVGEWSEELIQAKSLKIKKDLGLDELLALSDQG